MLITILPVATCFIFSATSFSAANGTAAIMISDSQLASAAQPITSASTVLLADLISLKIDRSFASSLPNNRILYEDLARLFAIAEPMLPEAPIIAIVFFVAIVLNFYNAKLRRQHALVH